MKTTPLVLLACCSGATAQTVFFDDFDGPDFLPHWSVPPPNRWSYDFNNGMLNVTGLHYPSNSHSSGNWASMVASFVPQAEFRVDAWMGWDAGQPFHRLGLYLMSPEGFGLAFFEYSDEGIFAPGPIVGAGGSNQFIFSTAPLPGIHHFTIARIASQFVFSLNGQHFATFPDNSGRALGVVRLFFLRSYPGEFAPLYVDRIQVVPCPGSVAFLSVALLFGARPRRRPWVTPWTRHR